MVKAIYPIRSVICLSLPPAAARRSFPPLRADAGNRTEAGKILDHMRERSRTAFVSAAFLATVHVGLGQVDEALAALAQAEKEHSYYVGWWKVDPELDALRSDPRFAALLEKVGLDK